MKPVKLSIKPYRNHRTGSMSWRVSGMMHGTRIRRNYQDKAYALAEKSALEITALQETSGLRSVGTFLTEAQLREAESLFLQIKDKPRSLAFYTKYGLDNHKEPDSLKTLSDAKDGYILQREEDWKKNRLEENSLNSIKSQMKLLVEMFPKILVAELDVEKIIQYCENGGKAAEKSFNNRRGAVSAFLKFAMSKEWIVKNPIDKVPRYDIAGKRGASPSLTAEKAKELMEYLETYENGKLVPFYALCLFAGIRPNGEISKLPVEAISLDNGIIRIDPTVSKVGMLRHVTIQPNLAEWLRAYPLDKHPIIVPGLRAERTKLNEQFGLGHDILRHTFISMHVGKFRSMGNAALQAGNSESIIKKHYYAVKSAEEAGDFWDIRPKKKGEPDAAAVLDKPAEAVEAL